VVRPDETSELRFILAAMNMMQSAGSRPRDPFPDGYERDPRHGGGSRTPVHPGHFLESRFMRPSGISQEALARALGISRRRVNELVRGRRGFTPDTAVRLAVFFHTDPRLWMFMQSAWDLHQAWRQLGIQRAGLNGDVGG